MNSIDYIDECVAENEEYTVTVGVFEKGQPRFIVFGGGGAIVAPEEHDYELCGVTQCFTAALFQKLLQDDKISFQTPLSAHFSEIPPEKDFTAYELLTHTSGLSLTFAKKAMHLFSALRPDKNPTVGIDRQALFSSLIKYKHIKGAGFVPCEANTALLGEMIASACGTSFKEQMNLFLKEDLHIPQLRLSNGEGTLPTPYWQRGEADSYIAANGIVSNVSGCLRFLHAALCKNKYIYPCTLPCEGIKTAQQQQAGLGWLINESGIVWQSGANAGFNAFFGLDYEHERAVCVLSNTAKHAGQSAAEAGLKYMHEKREGKEYVFM